MLMRFQVTQEGEEEEEEEYEEEEEEEEAEMELWQRPRGRLVTLSYGHRKT